MILIQLQPFINEENLQELKSILVGQKGKISEVQTGLQRFWVVQLPEKLDIRIIGNKNYVKDVHYVPEPYPLVSNKWRVEPSVYDLGNNVFIGGKNGEKIIAGPCSIENEQQVEKICQFLHNNKIRLMRGGIFKPRSSPYSFRGLGIEGLKMFYQIAQSYNIKIVTEVMEVNQIEPMYPYVDIFQVGARNSQNFNLLDALGKIDKPVLLKRGISGTIEELLYSAEYIFSAGNPKIILCERGIRTYETAYRNCFDVNAIAILKDKTHLPVFGDPSHGIGIRKYVPNIALAALAAGADGILVEVHPEPEKSVSDAQQTLSFEEFKKIIEFTQNLINS